jgi:pimeloyl-ACP methyl ester carboxylesterase
MPAADPVPPPWFDANCAAVPTVGRTEHDGCPIRWLRWGDPAAPPLVLIHGGAAHARWWQPLAPFLAGERCVVAPDLSGMGDSGWRADGYRVETWADEVLAVVADACPAANPGAAVLVGHSLGAAVATVAAVRHPDAVAAVVLCDSGGGGSGRRLRNVSHFVNRISYPTEAEAVARFTLIPRQPCANEWMVAHIARHSVRPVGPGGPRDPQRPPAGTEVAWAWKFDWRLFARTMDRPFAEYLEQVGRGPVPVACINGRDSRIVTPEVAERVRARLGTGRVVWIPEAGHHLMLDQPIAFVSAVEAVLVAQLPDGR